MGGYFARIIPTFGSSGNTEFCTSTSWIVPALLVPRKNGFLGEYFQPFIVAKSLLDPSIFERMETDDPKPPSNAEAIRYSPQGDLQRFQLFIDGDSQSLEGPCGRINLSLLSGARDRSAHNFCQLACCLDRFLSATLNNRPGDPSAVPLLTIGVNQVGQMFGFQAIYQPGGWLATLRIETQIEWAVRSETEASVLVRQLIARQAKIQQHAVNPANLELFEHFRQIGKIGVYHAHGQIAQRFPGTFDRVSVSVQRNQVTLRSHEPRQRPSMPAPAQRAVYQYRAGTRSEPFDDLFEQNGNVDGLTLGHGRRETLRIVRSHRSDLPPARL